jgi:hypothetical protein
LAPVAGRLVAERLRSDGTFLAVPLDTPETEARIEELLARRVGAMLYVNRGLQLGADIEPARLDPRPVKPAV